MSRPFGVEKDDDGEVEGCHATRGEANEQMAALYASEDTRSLSGAVHTKAIGIVDVDLKAVDTVDDAGAFEAVLSAPTLDRDGEIVDAKAFEPLPEWIPIDLDHGMSVDSIVASGRPFYDGDILKIAGTFASTPRAQEVRTLVREGHIRKMSVAFMDPVREVDEKDGKPHVRRAELLNAGIVAIPANREADILMAKTAALKVGARNSSSDLGLLQTAHDAIVAAGAACESKGAHTVTINNAADPLAVATEIAEKSTDTDPQADAAAPAAADPQAEVTVARAHAFAAEALLLLTD